MFLKNFAVLLTFKFLIICDSIFVENLTKCHLDDDVCLRDLYQSLVRDIGKHGIPEFNIPPVDPIHVTNVTVSVFNMVNITMVDGFIKGIKDCIFQKVSINIKEERGHKENTCDISIKGLYTIDAFSPFIEAFLGGNFIHGDGHGKVDIANLRLKLDFPFFAQRRDDGEIYLKCNYDLVKYDYEFGGPVSLYADNLYMGDMEVSKQIIDLINENWRFFMFAFGQPFVDKAMEFYFTCAGYFFDNVPARHFIIEDLSPYARP